MLPHLALSNDPARAHDVVIVRAALEAQRTLLAALAQRVSPASLRDLRNDDGWRGPAKWAFDLSVAALLGELSRAAEALRTAERLTEAALYEIDHRV